MGVKHEDPQNATESGRKVLPFLHRVHEDRTHFTSPARRPAGATAGDEGKEHGVEQHAG